MPFAGLDLHKQAIEAAIVDDDGSLLVRHRFPTEREAITTFAQQFLSPQHQVVVEATFNTWAVVELLEPHVARVVIANPLRTRAIAEAKIKTDKIDALVLAKLLHAGFIADVWCPDEQTRAARNQSTIRANLTCDRTRIKNRIHSILHQRLIQAPKNLFEPKQLEWLRGLELDAAGRTALELYLRQLDAVEQEIEQMHAGLAKQAWADPQTKLLMTIPGIDFPVAQSVLSAIGDITRFPDADKAAAYFGLVPSTRASGNHSYHGKITKQGNSHARWMLIQAAQHVDDHPGPLGAFFRRIANKKNRNVAVTAVARKLVTIAWHMLTKNEPYRYATPKTTAAKFDRLRILATGKRKKGGLAKGSARPAAYGTGKPTRAIPSLGQVYEANELPAPAELQPGERRTVEQTGTAGFVEQSRTAYRVPKNEGKRRPAVS